MATPLALVHGCDCGDCDFCGRGRGKQAPVAVREIWQRAHGGANSNQDLHICQRCAERLVDLFSNPEHSLVRGKLVAA